MNFVEIKRKKVERKSKNIEKRGKNSHICTSENLCNPVISRKYIVQIKKILEIDYRTFGYSVRNTINVKITPKIISKITHD